MANSTITNDILCKLAHVSFHEVWKVAPRPKKPTHWVDVELSGADAAMPLEELSKKYLRPAMTTLANQLFDVRGDAYFYPVKVPLGVRGACIRFGDTHMLVYEVQSLDDFKRTFRFAVAYC
jgi:hypothetical protein